MSVITPLMLTPNLSNQYESSQSPQPRCLAFRLSQIISSRVSHHNLDADFQPCPIRAKPVTKISVLCSSSNKLKSSHVGHHNLGVLAFHIPTSPTVTKNLVSYSSSSNQPWKSIRPTSVTTHSVSGHQSVQTTSLLLVTYTLGVPLSSPKLYSHSSISVSHYNLSADFSAHRFASIRTSSVTTTSVSGRQPTLCSLHIQPRPPPSRCLATSPQLYNHTEPPQSASIASLMSVYQPIALLSNELLQSAVHLGIDSSAHSSTLT